MKVCETKNYIIEYSEADEELLKEIIATLDNNSRRILTFFRLKNLDKQLKIVIWNSVETYWDYLERRGCEYKEWMIGGTYGGNLNVVSPESVRTTKNRSNYSLEDFLNTLVHEFVHICHRQVNETYTNGSMWFAEALAINLSNQKYRYENATAKKGFETLNNVSTPKLQTDFKNVPSNYLIAYMLGRYLLENCESDYIYNLVTDSTKAENELSSIVANAISWYKEHQRKNDLAFRQNS